MLLYIKDSFINDNSRENKNHLNCPGKWIMVGFSVGLISDNSRQININYDSAEKCYLNNHYININFANSNISYKKL